MRCVVTIQAIAQNNNSPQTLIQRINYQIQRKHSDEDHTNNEQQAKKTWATFTYYSAIVRKITNIFKHTNIGWHLKTLIHYSNL